MEKLIVKIGEKEIECEPFEFESIRTMKYEGIFDGLHKFTDWLGELQFRADETFIIGKEYDFKDLPL